MIKKCGLAIVAFILSGILLWSCSEDNSTEPDTSAPTINIEYPADNAEFVVGSIILIKANATDNESIAKVEFFIDGNIVKTVTKPPFEYSLNTSGITGNHTITAKAYDSSDNTASSNIVNIKINEVNKPPVITSMSALPSTVYLEGTSALKCTAGNADGDVLTYTWIKSAGIITGTGSSVTWTAPGTAGIFSIKCEVSDGKDTDTDSLFVTVTDQPINNLPVINSVTIDSLSIYPNNSTQIICSADDADGDELNYIWNSTAGTINGTGPSVIWTAPDSILTCNIDCTVSDGIDSISVRRSVYVSDGTITAVMVYVQGGTFDMGDHFNEGLTNELPVHSVTLSDFNIGKFEVTQNEWAAIMGSNPASAFGVGSNYPVYYISFYEIIVYCNRRSISERLTPCYSISDLTNPDEWGNAPTSSNAEWDRVECNWDANGYRLPTEAEWEYAVRGGIHYADNYHYSGSDIIDDVAWYKLNNDPVGTKPVGSKASNQLGVHDMSGNISEWCWDWFGSSYYTSCYENGVEINPHGPETGTSRVLRGGFWDILDYNCRVSYRDYNILYYKNLNFGFRLVRKF